MTNKITDPTRMAVRSVPGSIQKERIMMQLKMEMAATFIKNLSLSPSSRRFIRENDRIAEDMAVTTNIMSDENTS